MNKRSSIPSVPKERPLSVRSDVRKFCSERTKIAQRANSRIPKLPSNFIFIPTSFTWFAKPLYKQGLQATLEKEAEYSSESAESDGGIRNQDPCLMLQCPPTGRSRWTLRLLADRTV